MVGVAGKSQGCHDCRRRRVKCDLTKPTCLRCQGANLICGGYIKASVFINQTQSNAKISTTSVISEIVRGRNCGPTIASLDVDLVLESLIYQVTGTQSSTFYQPRTEFRQHALQLIRRLYLPKPNQRINGQFFGRNGYSWLESLEDLSEQNEALDYALVAFGAILAHVARSRNVSIEKGLALYSESIRRLWTTLEDPHARYQDETLAAIVVLSTCELFVCPADDGWQAHARGVSVILRLRGHVEHETTPTWQSLCARLRIVCILLGVANRRTPSLSPPEWSLIMSARSNAKSFDELIDIMAVVPVLLEESDIFLTRNNTMIQEQWRGKIILSLLSVLEKLRTWQTELQSVARVYWAVPSSLHNPADDSYDNTLFPFSLEFESLDMATFFLLSWGVMLQILSTIIQVSSVFVDHDAGLPAFDQSQKNINSVDLVNMEEFDVSSFEMEAEQISRYTCQSIEFFHRAEMGLVGPQSTCYTQWALRHYFRNTPGHDRELEWCLNLKNLRDSGSRCGIDLMTFRD